MRKNLNLAPPVCIHPAKFDDGVVIPLNVDNFPCANPAYVKKNGFRANDISVLERFSTAHHDQSEIDIVAARIKELQKSPANNMTDEQLLKTLKPAWVQTASELTYFNERMYSLLSESDVKSVDLQKADSTSVSTENVDTSNTPVS